MGDVILDAFIDSLKILAVLVVCNVIIALIEPRLSKKVKLKGAAAPLIGVSVGLLPQCGFSVVAADLYQKRHITIGTLIGVFLATSDEALPIFLSYPDKALDILPILGLKFLLGLIFGYLIDFIYTKNKKNVEEHLDECDEEYKIRLTHCDKAELVGDEQTDGCVQKSEKQKKKERIFHGLDKFLLDPLMHSLKIFIYIFIVNIIFGVVIYYVGEDKLISFLTANRYVAPLLAVLVGAIPNCVSSVVLSELYILGGLGFGATLGGLCMNAGLGFVVLLKNKKDWKNNLVILGIMFLISVFVAYIFSAIFNFAPLNY